MAEEEGDLESERFKKQLGSLLNCRISDEYGTQSKDYCARFCELVEDQTGRWQVPLPQLQVLRTALCYFARDTATFPSDCEHVHYALSSLALSFFELLLFFGKDEFLESPLKEIIESFQECQTQLERHKNVYLLLVKQVIKDGGPWENAVLQAILRETAPAQEEVERYLSSEGPVFFELRVRYLLACERIQEAVTLAKSCIEHPKAGRCLYFHQAYLTCLLKASLYDHLQKEIADIDGKDAVEIICNSENEERDDLLLALSRAFLIQQLQNGDMYYIWDLIFIWSKIHLRANPSKQDFLEECHQLMLSATNVKSIFPFIKVIRAELGNEGLQFCVELCGRALQMDLHQDPVTKLLIYKTLAFLLPNDLEVCRACALLVFFLERTVESYKTVYLLYTHPDQEYQVDYSLIKNHIRFEILQILKKGLFFDPEFWNLITLRTNCLKLMSEKVMQAALKEIMEEDKWIPNYCVKEPPKIILDAPVYHTDREKRQPVKRLVKNKPVIKRIVVPPEVVEVSLVKKRGRKPGSRVIKVTDDSQLRRSFRQLDMAQENSTRQLHQKHDNRQQRLLARQVEKKTLKRRGRKPRWLLQEVAKQAENRLGEPGRKNQLATNAGVEMRLHDHTLVQTDNDTEKAQEVSMEQTSCDVERTTSSPAEKAEEIGLLEEEGMPLLAIPLLDEPLLTPVPVTMLEVSIPDNEVMDTLEVEMQPLSDVVLEECSLEDRVNMEVAPTEVPFTESYDREEDTADKPPCNTSLCALPPEARSEVYPAPAIEVDNVVIQQLHNYSRNPQEENVEQNVQVPDALPEQLPSVPQACLSESTMSEQELAGEVCELPLVDVAPHLQAPVGVPSSSEADGEVPDSIPAVVEVVPEAVLHQEVIQAEASCVPVESSISDNMDSVSHDETTIPNDPSSAPQHTVAVLDKSVIACTRNFENTTDTVENSVNAFGSDITADPNKETASSEEAVPNGETIPREETVSNGETAPRGETVSSGETVSTSESAPREDTVSSGETVPREETVSTSESAPREDAVSSGETVPREETVSSGESVPRGETVPNSETVPREEIVPNGETAPREETVSSGETVPNEEIVPSDVINSVINVTVSQIDAASGPGQDSGLPLELSQTDILEQEKGSAESEPLSGSLPDAILKKVLQYRCKLCNKEFKGGNIRRHAVAHLQRDKLKCMFCGKLFNRPLIAKKHLVVHIEKLKLEADSSCSSAPENGTPETLECGRRSLSRSAKHKMKPEASAQKIILSKKRKCTKKLKVLQKLEDVSESKSVKDKKPVQKANGSIGEGEMKCEKEEHLCPADGCTKKFVKRGMSMIKHALVSHPSDIKVQEFAFHWRKGKCEFCQRIFWSFLHYQDHIKRHNHPLKHCCLHTDCNTRFKTKSELRVHLKSHQPLQAQCSFAGCSQTFRRLSQLQDHEWQHYPASDTKDDVLRTMQMSRKLSRPVRGKRKDTRNDSGKVQMASAKPQATVLISSGTGGKLNDKSNSVGETSTVERPVGTEDMRPPEGSGSEAQIVNGHRENVTLSHTQVDAISTPETGKETTVEINNVDRKLEPESKTSHQEPVVQTQRKVKEVEKEHSSYGGTSGRPFVRPPPSAYLDECYISMPKRRKSSPDDSCSSVEPSNSSCETLRRRCSKCFSSFKSEEALQSHQSLNKCTSLFGFDSDEESAS